MKINESFTAQHLLEHIKQMDHRERIVLTIPRAKRSSVHPLAYGVEIYVTIPFAQLTIGGGDQNRVLIQVVNSEGKNVNKMPKTSIKRGALSTKSGPLAKAWEWVQ